MTAASDKMSDAQVGSTQVLPFTSTFEVDSTLQEFHSNAQGYAFDKEAFLQTLREYKFTTARKSGTMF